VREGESERRDGGGNIGGPNKRRSQAGRLGSR
jgi:hypothetical protein